MRTGIQTDKVLEANRKFHDEVEALDYDLRMGVRHTQEDVKRIVDELESVLGHPLPGGTRVVDLGAGTGNLAVKLAIDGRFSSVAAVDISPKMLEKAEQSAKDHGCEVETIVSDMTRLPFEDSSVDLMVGCAMLHHVPEPEALLKEVHRVMKPGAPMVIIGEPSVIGEQLTYVLKLPVILAVKVYRMITGRTIQIWEHDMIDVHTFNLGEIRKMSSQFSNVSFRCEGFMEPLIDQGVLVIVRRALRIVPGIDTFCNFIQKAMRGIDRVVLNRILPQSAFFTIKFAGWK